jgi:uncharacterized protein (TIGR03084 family)
MFIRRMTFDEEREMKEICRELAREHEFLDSLVADLDEAGWNQMTPAEGWTIKDQICHLAYFDERARLSATDPETFSKDLEKMRNDPQGFSQEYTKLCQSKSISEMLEWWRQERTALTRTFEDVDPKLKLPWYGPPMSARSSATARYMEAWAHGQDIVDCLGADHPPTEGLRNIAHLGVITFGWSYANRQMKIPEKPLRVELTSPAGELWTWGPEDAEDVVSGPAQDFCLVVTQRRNLADTQLNTKGSTATEWMSLTQCFAGPPTMGPAPGTRSGK